MNCAPCSRFFLIDLLGDGVDHDGRRRCDCHGAVFEVFRTAVYAPLLLGCQTKERQTVDCVWV